MKAGRKRGEEKARGRGSEGKRREEGGREGGMEGGMGEGRQGSRKKENAS
jgi:hypothetical protein